MIKYFRNSKSISKHSKSIPSTVFGILLPKSAVFVVFSRFRSQRTFSYVVEFLIGVTITEGFCRRDANTYRKQSAIPVFEPALELGSSDNLT